MGGGVVGVRPKIHLRCALNETTVYNTIKCIIIIM